MRRRNAYVAMSEMRTRGTAGYTVMRVTASCAMRKRRRWVGLRTRTDERSAPICGAAVCPAGVAGPPPQRPCETDSCSGTQARWQEHGPGMAWPKSGCNQQETATPCCAHSAVCCAVVADGPLGPGGACCGGDPWQRGAEGLDEHTAAERGHLAGWWGGQSGQLAWRVCGRVYMR